MSDLDRDITILALTAYAEASSEGVDGIRAQVHSVVNRFNVKRWYSRKTIAGTCLLQYSYSALNTTDPNRVRAAETPASDPVMATCFSEAANAISGITKDTTGGATHYYREGTKEPDWVSGINSVTKEQVAPPAAFTVKIGKHLFYKDVT